MKNAEMVKKLVDAISKLEYGSTITHMEIESLIGLKSGTTRYHSVMQSTKKKLLALQRCIESVYGMGYKLIMPDDYVEKASQSYSAGLKRIKRGNDVLANAPVTAMSEDGKKIYQEVSDRARSLYAVTSGACVTINNLKQKNHPLLLSQKNF